MLTVQTGVHGYVLCFGQDGHVAMEAALEGSCGPGQPCGVPIEEGKSLEEEHQAACLDIPPEYEAVLKRHDLQLDLPSPQLLFLTVTKTNDLAGPPLYQPKPFPRETMRVSQTLRAHRTVVLLN